MPIEDIVNVRISRDTTAVQRAAFGTLLFLGQTPVVAARYQTYSGTKGMLEAGYKTTDPEYIAALAYFSQEISPDRILIGRQLPTTVVFTAAEKTGGGYDQKYSVKIGDTVFTYDNAIVNPSTATSAANGLKGLIDAGSEDITATVSGESLVLAPDTDPLFTATNPVTTLSPGTMTVTYTSSEDLSAALAAIAELTSAWYGVATYSVTPADIVDVAIWTEANKRLYGYSTSQAAVLVDVDPADKDIMSQLADLNYVRTWGLFDEDAGVSYPEAAWFGVMLAIDPGAATWAFKTLVGQDADYLTTSQSEQVLTKNGNVYQEIGGVSITREGTVASGEYIDIIRGVDWLESRMEETIYAALVNSPKIPYTTSGIETIASLVSGQLQDGIEQGVIADTPPFVVNVPEIAAIPTADKLARELNGITFTATLAGAIQKVVINGSVTV